MIHKEPTSSSLHIFRHQDKVSLQNESFFAKCLVMGDLWRMHFWKHPQLLKTEAFVLNTGTLDQSHQVPASDDKVVFVEPA